MQTTHPAAPIEVKDLYKTLIDTRNFEINLYWQRSNYFLALNSAIALGFFTMKAQPFIVPLACVGLMASVLWFWVCLGGKFWQSRWEQRLADFEHEHLPDLDFFAANWHRINSDVERSLTDPHRKRWQRFIYRLVLKRPSVSYSMMLLSLLFVMGWVVLLVVCLCLGHAPAA